MMRALLGLLFLATAAAQTTTPAATTANLQYCVASVCSDDDTKTLKTNPAPGPCEGTCTVAHCCGTKALPCTGQDTILTDSSAYDDIQCDARGDRTQAELLALNNQPACSTGMYLLATTRTGTCRRCDKGQYDPNSGNFLAGGGVCNETTGEYNQCPVGRYCPVNDTATCNSEHGYAGCFSTQNLECPKDSICFPGFTEPSKCGFGINCDAGTDKRNANNISIVGLLALLLIGCPTCCLLNRRYNLRQKDAEFLRDSFKPDPSKTLGDGLPKCTTPVTIKFKDVGMTLKKGGLRILSGVTGYYPPASLVALMGPSGGGKTTFMNALLGRAAYANVEGEVMVNGVKDGLIRAANVVGFVPQDDIVYEDLTVHQNLYYSALTRLPAAMDDDKKKAYVQEVLQVLGIAHVESNIVGSVAKRGISGGQKKRVNIGMELVARPSVIFMDEPTSGLDGAATLELAQCLAQMRASGLTIVCVIHQPRFTVFKEFTHLLLLGAGGRQIYGGRTERMTMYLEGLNFRLPDRENPADWMIDVACNLAPHYMGARGTTDQIDTAYEAPKMLFEAWESQHAPTANDPNSQWNAPAPSEELIAQSTPLEMRRVPGCCRQFTLFWGRALDQTSLRSFITTNVILWVASAGLALARASGYTYTYTAGGFAAPYVNMLIFNYIMSIQTHGRFYNERLQVLRDFKSGSNALAYFFARTTYGMTRQFFYIFAWTLPEYSTNTPMIGFGSFFLIWWSTMIYWTGFAQFISSSVDGFTTGILILVFWPVFELLVNGAAFAPAHSGFIRIVSVVTAGRWQRTAQYCGELQGLPAQARRFNDIPFVLMNETIVPLSCPDGSYCQPAPADLGYDHQIVEIVPSGQECISTQVTCQALPNMTEQDAIRDFIDSGLQNPTEFFNHACCSLTSHARAATDDEINAGFSRAIALLWMMGAVFRLLTLLRFMLTRNAQGSNTVAQILYLIKANLAALCGSRTEVVNVAVAGSRGKAGDFQSANLRTVLGGERLEAFADVTSYRGQSFAAVPADQTEKVAPGMVSNPQLQYQTLEVGSDPADASAAK